jgi:DNA-directed RNA polymerase sigma subunit (sigma70/sigma32)
MPGIVSLKKEFDRVLNTMPQREADIIRLFFGVNGKHTHTLGEIGEEFNLTRENEIMQIPGCYYSNLFWG